MKLCTWLILGFCGAPMARAGVGQGNPAKPTFFSMKMDYGLSVPSDLEVLHGVTGAGVRLDVPIRFRELGYFWLDALPPQVDSAWKICAQTEIKDSKATLFWVGKDCELAFFSGAFRLLEGSIYGIKFPH